MKEGTQPLRSARKNKIFYYVQRIVITKKENTLYFDMLDDVTYWVSWEANSETVKINMQDILSLALQITTC